MTFIDGPCPIARGLNRVGDLWSMLILRDAGSGKTRFDEFQRSLGIAPNILTRRLTALVGAGLLERRRYCERPPRDEYVMTGAARAFLPVLYAFGEWGAEHYSDGNVTKLVNATDGAVVRPTVVDRDSGMLLSMMDLEALPPPND